MHKTRPALQSLLRRLHVRGQVIAVAAFMLLPTHTAARLVQAALARSINRSIDRAESEDP